MATALATKYLIAEKLASQQQPSRYERGPEATRLIEQAGPLAQKFNVRTILAITVVVIIIVLIICVVIWWRKIKGFFSNIFTGIGKAGRTVFEGIKTAGEAVATTTTKAIATIPKSYGRGVGKPLQMTCPDGKQLYGGLCYKSCPAGSTRRAVCTCGFGSYGGVRTNCFATPSIIKLKLGEVCTNYGPEYRKTALCTCQKRGLVTSCALWGDATTPAYGCLAGYEKSGLLCYPYCNEGYHGVGPVCWENK
jgi:hypothetical protein